jgi:hypothetical protein
VRNTSRKSSNNSKPGSGLRSSLLLKANTNKGPLESIPEAEAAHMDHSAAERDEEDVLGPSSDEQDDGDEEPLLLAQQEDDVEVLEDPDLAVDPEPEIHVSDAPAAATTTTATVVSPRRRRKWENEKADAVVMKSTITPPRFCNKSLDESSTTSSSTSSSTTATTKSTSGEPKQTSLPTQQQQQPPSPPPSSSPLYGGQRRWEAVSSEVKNVILLTRNLSNDDSITEALRVEEDDNEDEDPIVVVVVPESHPSVMVSLIESSDSNETPSSLRENKEPQLSLQLQQQEVVPDSPSVSLETETSESNETLEMDMDMEIALLLEQEPPAELQITTTKTPTTWSIIVPDPADPRPRSKEEQREDLKDQQRQQQTVVSKRRPRVDVDNTCTSSSFSTSRLSSTPFFCFESEEGYLPLNDEDDNQSLCSSSSSSSMPPLSPISDPGSETSSLATRESITSSNSEEVLLEISPKPEKKKKKSVKIKTKKEKKPRKASSTAISGPGLAEKKEKKRRRAIISEPINSKNVIVSEKKKEKRPRRVSIHDMTVPAAAAASEKVVTEQKKKEEKPCRGAPIETVTVPGEAQRTMFETVAAPEPTTSVKSVHAKEKKSRRASIETSNTVSDATSDKSSEKKEKKPPRRSPLLCCSIKNAAVESSSELKETSRKSKKEKKRSSNKASDASEKKEKSLAAGKENKKKARKTADPMGESPKTRRSKSKTPKSPKKSKNTKKKSSKSKSSSERLSMSMPDLLEATTNSETDFDESINFTASTGALSYDATQASSSVNDLYYSTSSMLSKQDSEQDQVEQESSANELFYSASSLLSPRSEHVATVKSQPVVSTSEQSIETSPSVQRLLVGQLESTLITHDEKADASAPTEQPNSESQSELLLSAQTPFDMEAAELEEAVEQEPESTEMHNVVERTSSIELCSCNSEERELCRQDEGADSANELFYSAQSFLSASGEDKDAKSQQSFAEEGSQDSASCTSVGEPEVEAHDASAGIDMKGVQFLLGHLQVILNLDALMKYPHEDETSPNVLPPIEAKIRARWGLINALGKTEEAKQAQKDFALEYGLLSTDVDELISHLRLCERTGVDVRWDLVYQMVFPESEIRWGVFDQILQPADFPTTHPDMESVEWSGCSFPPSEEGSSHKQAGGHTPTADVPVNGNSLAALFSAATNPSNVNEVPGMARIEDEIEATEASSNDWRYVNELLYDTQAQLAFRMEYDLTDEEFAAMLRHLSHCKASNTKVEWGKMEEVLCGGVSEGVDEDIEDEDGRDAGSDHSSYCSVRDWNTESVAGESYFSVYPENDDCASELTFYHDDRSVYMEDDMSIGSYSVYTYISEAMTEGPKEPVDDANQNPLQLSDSRTTDALRITRSTSFNGPRKGPGRSSSFNGTRRGPDRTYSFNGPRRGAGRTSSFNGPRREPLGPNSSFSGPRRGKRGVVFNRTPLVSIQDMHDFGLAQPSAQWSAGSSSIGQSDRATGGSPSVVKRKPSRLIRRYHSASAALENLAEALVHQRAVF